MLIFAEFLPKLFELTNNDNKTIQKEAFWMIGNITAGKLPETIDKIIENDDYVMRLKTALSTGPSDVQDSLEKTHFIGG